MLDSPCGSNARDHFAGWNETESTERGRLLERSLSQRPRLYAGLDLASYQRASRLLASESLDCLIGECRDAGLRQHPRTPDQA
jgi:hypothetical protein